VPLETPFHPRTQAACLTYKWKDWAGYHAVCRYGLSPEREYNAVRQASGLIDVTPLFKYEVRGPEAGRFLSRVLVRDVSGEKVGRMRYLCWCDGDGKVLDDGTVARLGEDHFRLTSAAPAMHWLGRHAEPFDVAIEDLSATMAAVALQGPTSRDLLRRVSDADLDALRYFAVTPTRFEGGGEGWLSRTGYTGDLGYELWVENDRALALWDALMAEGKAFGIEPVGLDALDILRVEAGYILRGVDYTPANEALIEAQKSSPFELGLGWTVKLDGRSIDCVGQRALEREKGGEQSTWAFAGLEIDWLAVERLHARHGLPPQVPAAAWRASIPIHADGKQVGYATSGTWSPVLKKNLALVTIEPGYAAPGTPVFIEQTVEHVRTTVPATVTKTPFFDPERKRS
jgi:aminomethyltransferase